MLSFTLTAILLLGVNDKKEPDPPAEPKIHGRATFDLYRKTVVIKSGEQLNMLTASNASIKQITADLARRLKVDGIDWNKQMVIVIYGGERPTGGYNVELKSLKAKDGKLVVQWKLNTPAPDSIVTQVITHPTLVILVDRFDGDVVFDPMPMK